MIPNLSRSSLLSTEDSVYGDYDFGFYTVGYERRSRHIASQLKERTNYVTGICYFEPKGLALPENLAWCHQNATACIPARDYRLDHNHEFRRSILEHIPADRQQDLMRGWVDVSSMDRSLMARTLLTLLQTLSPPYLLRILYAPAAFSEPSYAFNPVRDCSPLIPELAGKLGRPDREIRLILGLGYEYGVALGLIQQFEPDFTFAFAPKGNDIKYEAPVKKANFDFNFGTDQIRHVVYMVDQPVNTFDRLLSLTSDAAPARSVVIVPNGPKIFAAIAILIGLIRIPSYIGVLRASQSDGLPAHHVEASGPIISMDWISE